MSIFFTTLLLGYLFDGRGTLLRWIVGAISVLGAVAVGIGLGNGLGSGLESISAISAALAIIGYNGGLAAALVVRLRFRPSVG